MATDLVKILMDEKLTAFMEDYKAGRTLAPLVAMVVGLSSATTNWQCKQQLALLKQINKLQHNG